MAGNTLQRRIVLDGSDFDPRSVSGLQLWLDATNMGAFNDGDSVPTWVDRSGAGNNVSQGTGLLQPIYKTGIQNGKPIVRFDGLTQYLTGGNILGNVTGGFTFFIVARVNTVAATRELFSKSTGSASTPYEFRIASATQYQVASNIGATLQTFGTGAVTVTNFNVIAGSINPASPVELYVGNTSSGAQTVTPTGTIVVNAGAPFNVGARNNGTLPASIDVGDLLIVVNPNLSIPVIQAIINYLRSKWGT